MRIGVLHSGAAAHTGGGFSFERDLFQSLLAVAPNSKHSFVILDPPPALRNAKLPANVELQAGAAVPEPLHRVLRRLRLLRLRRLIRSAGVDIVWNLSPGNPASDAPFITVVWDLQHRLQPLFPEVSRDWTVRERHYAATLRRAAAVIAGTDAGREEIASFYQVSKERIHILPHPTPAFALHAAESGSRVLERLRLSAGGYLFYPAQFWPHKNHVNLLLALRMLREGGLELPLVLAGSDKGNLGMVRACAEQLGLQRQVRFAGFVSEEEIVALYRGALCLVYVSLFGPENMPPLEAFALGCPVVAADVSGAREQLGDAALRVDAVQPEQIAEAVRRINQDPALRADLKARGLARARRWTGADFVRGVFGILDGLEGYVRTWRWIGVP